MKELFMRNLALKLPLAADHVWKTAVRFLVIPLIVADVGFLGTVRAADHPTKDQVVKFVEEGVDFIKKNGKEAFFKEVTTGTSFKRGELYFYVYDYNCICLAHGLKPGLVGKDLSDMTDAKQTKFNQALRDQAKNGSGWVTFYFQNPTSHKVEKKFGYAVKVDDTFWFGSGTYSSDAE